MIDLSTKYLGLKLRTPLVASASPHERLRAYERSSSRDQRARTKVS
jgi:hypothetical protein